VSGSKQIAVTRDYQPEPDVCAQALELVLKTSVRKEGGPTIADPMKAKGVLMSSPPQRSIPDEPNLLASIRELYSRLPEMRGREAWELQHVLFSLGYTDDLAPEAEIEAAIGVARSDYDQDEGAA
jgi:hypothetical protein